MRKISSMSTDRFVELLAYASVCFDHCCNPFDSTHLIQKHVTADECRDLSHGLADILEQYFFMMGITPSGIAKVIQHAKKEYEETQT